MSDSLFSNDAPLRVCRVRAYRVPRYPNYTDPDPTTSPAPVPYPWKSRVAAALFVLGEGHEALKADDSVPPPPYERVLTPAEEAEVEQLTEAAMLVTPKGEQNPFSEELGFSRLPYVPSPYGTGAPIPLDSAVAQKLISRIFAAEGLQAQPATFIEKDFTASAQGYDPEKRIGYIVASRENMADDAMQSRMAKRLEAIALEKSEIQNPNDPKQRSSVDSLGSDLFWGAALNEEQKRELAAITNLKTSRAKAQAYLDLAAKVNAKANDPKLSMDEISHAEKMAEERQRYLAIISVLDHRFQFYHVKMKPRLRAIEEEAEKRNFDNVAEEHKWLSEQEALILAEMRREKLALLAQSVREYIAWARRNGLQ